MFSTGPVTIIKTYIIVNRYLSIMSYSIVGPWGGISLAGTWGKAIFLSSQNTTIVATQIYLERSH